MLNITATEFARNLSSYLDRLEFGSEEIIINRKKHPIAKISPGTPHMKALDAFADIFGILSDEEGEKWLKHTQVAAAVDNCPVYSAPPVIAELEYGVYRAKNPAQKAKRVSTVAKIKRKPCLNIDRDTGEIFGCLAANLDQRGKPSTYRVHYLWLAALAIQHNLKILTQNPKDFRDIPGVDLVAI